MQGSLQYDRVLFKQRYLLLVVVKYEVKRTFNHVLGLLLRLFLHRELHPKLKCPTVPTSAIWPYMDSHTPRDASPGMTAPITGNPIPSTSDLHFTISSDDSSTSEGHNSPGHHTTPTTVTNLHETSRPRSRSPQVRSSASSHTNPPLYPTSWYTEAKVAPPVLHNLATTLENSIQQAFDFLPHHQVRLHIDYLLARNLADRATGTLNQAGLSSSHRVSTNSLRQDRDMDLH